MALVGDHPLQRIQGRFPPGAAKDAPPELPAFLHSVAIGAPAVLIKGELWLSNGERFDVICMQFIPGSQKLEVLPHHSINNDPRIHRLELNAGAGDVSHPAICPIPAGGCTIHPSRTLHYTAPNLSDAPRRVYILVFTTPKKKLPVSRNFYWNKQKHTARQERAEAAKG